MPAPANVRPWHMIVADMLIGEPHLRQGEIAARLGRSQTWLSIVINGDAFKEYLATRREEIIDPVLTAKTEQRLEMVANAALDKIHERLATNAPFTNRELVATVEVAARGLGLGQAKGIGLQQNLYVVQAPPVATTSQQWVDMVPRPPGELGGGGSPGSNSAGGGG